MIHVHVYFSVRLWRQNYVIVLICSGHLMAGKYLYNVMPRAHIIHTFLTYFMYLLFPLLLPKLAAILPIHVYTLRFTTSWAQKSKMENYIWRRFKMSDFVFKIFESEKFKLCKSEENKSVKQWKYLVPSMCWWIV